MLFCHPETTVSCRFIRLSEFTRSSRDRPTFFSRLRLPVGARLRIETALIPSVVKPTFLRILEADSAPLIQPVTLPNQSLMNPINRREMLKTAAVASGAMLLSSVTCPRPTARHPEFPAWRRGQLQPRPGQPRRPQCRLAGADEPRDRRRKPRFRGPAHDRPRQRGPIQIPVRLRAQKGIRGRLGAPGDD